jgi:hypothetical protein
VTNDERRTTTDVSEDKERGRGGKGEKKEFIFVSLSPCLFVSLSSSRSVVGGRWSVVGGR